MLDVVPAARIVLPLVALVPVQSVVASGRFLPVSAAPDVAPAVRAVAGETPVVDTMPPVKMVLVVVAPSDISSLALVVAESSVPDGLNPVVWDMAVTPS